ncbi:hypothetical protein ACIGT4_02065 [Streptomyces sioyaensis]|uniref:hypothetical protein n=1 Tax=Streptomyces sioyaensis TaxID=67364 RepID=UPI0037D82D41
MTTTETQPAQGHGVSCTKCADLERDLKAADQAGDMSKAVDCRVLLRRHPQHDGVAVEIGALSRTRGDET